MDVYQKLSGIQQKLKAPKGQTNKFGGYKYRSQEDILEAVKPLLDGALLTLSDEIKDIGGRVYVEATACFQFEGKHVSVSASAREAITKKGMDDAQITGSASSYARKYALNGLFLIDDTKDSDATNDHKPNKHQEWAALLHGYLNTEEHDALYNEFTAMSGKDQDFVSEAWKYLPAPTRSKMKQVINDERRARENG